MMKLLLLQFAALTASFVLPDEQVSYLQNVKIQTSRAVNSAISQLPSKPEGNWFPKDALERASEGIEKAFEDAGSNIRDVYFGLSSNAEEAKHEAIDSLRELEQDWEQNMHSSFSEAKHWFSTTKEKAESFDAPDFLHQSKLGHSKPNMTVYQLISSSKYTQKLAKLVSEYTDLVETLNGTAANYTLFAPTDRAFEHLPKHHKPSKDIIEKVLKYHISPEYFPVKGILAASTIPTLLKSPDLGKKSLQQRLKTRIGWTGVTINFNTRVTGVDKFATNGVVHYINSFVPPPLRTAEIIDLFPAAYSTFQLGLIKTGLWESINTTDPSGGTLFTPPNAEFEKLGSRTVGFLFSKPGLKYLKAILSYHICPKNTLYSDAFYKASSSNTEKFPGGQFHADLPTLLKDRDLSIDIARLGRLVEIKINAYQRVLVSDVVSQDGVIQVSQLLLPPKKVDDKTGDWDGKSELTVEEIKERLDPYIVRYHHTEEL